MTAAQDGDRRPEVLAYARAVRAALRDVPGERTAELLEDLEEHLAETAADSPEPLETRLGPPEDYAEELRRSAGLAGATAHPSTAAVNPAQQLMARARDSRAAREVWAFLPELRPAWWVFRAWAALIAVDAVLLGAASFPVPTLGLGPLFGLLLTAAAVVFSVRMGRRSAADPDAGRRAWVLIGNGVLAVLALMAVAAIASRPQFAEADQVGPVDHGPQTLVREDGTPITNIYPYSSDGEPLTGVLLYDQDGRPLDNLSPYTAEGVEVRRVPAAPPQPANSFPQQQQAVTFDEYGRPVPVEPTAPEVTPSPSAPATTPAPPVTPAPPTSAPVGPGAVPTSAPPS